MIVCAEGGRTLLDIEPVALGLLQLVRHVDELERLQRRHLLIVETEMSTL